MLDVLKLFVERRDAPVKEIHFEGDIGAPRYVTVSQEQMQQAVDQFLGPRTPRAREAAAPVNEPRTAAAVAAAAATAAAATSREPALIDSAAFGRGARGGLRRQGATSRSTPRRS